jgi:para-aminobenzoate synthetase/4-amino-4-deoxychorismate lyase
MASQPRVLQEEQHLVRIAHRGLPAIMATMAADSQNSVLLDTSRPDSENHCSYLFLSPIRTLKIETLDAIPALFGQIEEYLRKGWYVAGFMTYECGYGLEPSFGQRLSRRSALPLAWLGVYERPIVLDHASGLIEPAPPPFRSPAQTEVQEARVFDCRLAMDREVYYGKISRIRDYIAAGDTYQVNFTSKIRFGFSGSPAALFTQLRDRQKVPYAAYLHFDRCHILSLSPELFFRIKGGRIITRPMKGTAARGRTVQEDERVKAWLRADPKNRSENVMIVDLLRSDLGKVAETGSIRVDDLFSTEKYETLFQMTSTISATLPPGMPLLEIFRAMFPSGSVTGAPKVRTMQIIQELEPEARGVYTGAIGYASPNGDAIFNVAIRTIVLNGNSGEMGIGSGIVFDSVASQEYEECQLKACFLTQPQPTFELLESLLWDGSYQRLDSHLARMKSSAEFFGFNFKEAEVHSSLQQNSVQLKAGSRYKVRLLVSDDGTVRLENALLRFSAGTGTVILSPHKISSDDRFLYHKTTHRELYESAYAEASRQGHEDVIFTNERGEITEGTRNNVFIETGNALITPPMDCGLLPGVFRRYILETDPRAVERVVSVNDLRSADAIYLCNSVRGMRRVHLGPQG